MNRPHDALARIRRALWPLIQRENDLPALEIIEVLVPGDVLDTITVDAFRGASDDDIPPALHADIAILRQAGLL